MIKSSFREIDGLSFASRFLIIFMHTWNCNFLGDFLVWKQSNKFLTLFSMERDGNSKVWHKFIFQNMEDDKNILGFFFLNSLSKIAYVEFTSRNYDLQRKVTNQTWLIFACYMSLAQSNNCKKLEFIFIGFV